MAENIKVGYHPWGRAGILQVIANNERSMNNPATSKADRIEYRKNIARLRAKYAPMLLAGEEV